MSGESRQDRSDRIKALLAAGKAPSSEDAVWFAEEVSRIQAHLKAQELRSAYLVGPQDRWTDINEKQAIDAAADVLASSLDDDCSFAETAADAIEAYNFARDTDYRRLARRLERAERRLDLLEGVDPAVAAQADGTFIRPNRDGERANPSDIPDPYCTYCGGAGERFWHSPDCDNDDCALNGDLDSCQGQAEPCCCLKAVGEEGRAP